MNKEQYFFRTVIYTTQGENVLLVNASDPKASTILDPWLGIVVSLADGEHTIQELFDYVAASYQDNPPENLEDTLRSVIERLKENSVIHLDDNPVSLPYYLAIPANEQDPAKAKKLMKQDGFTAYH
ncbi:hypothetical protein MNBD_GAMMA26-250 [hydrothermal vent metagenome]|uniref:Uncharacterized protein n=1 Tax=hydrothermal vent metagenome TaxID=652676 RepID=A0A3B1B879_9ZZZZ